MKRENHLNVRYIIQENEVERAEEASQADAEDSQQAEVSLDGEVKVQTDTTQQSQPSSPKPSSPLPNALEMRSTDDDLLGGMDIEQISDEELEDDARTSESNSIAYVNYRELICNFVQLFSSSRRS